METLLKLLNSKDEGTIEFTTDAFVKVRKLIKQLYMNIAVHM